MDGSLRPLMVSSILLGLFVAALVLSAVETRINSAPKNEQGVNAE
jgi:hypothetical protein